MKRKIDRPPTSKASTGVLRRDEGTKPMSRRNRIESEVEKTLAVGDRQEPFAARPDFQARLQARIRNGKGGRRPGLAVLFRRSVFVPAALALLLALNILTAVLILGKPATDSAGRGQSLAVLAEEYDLKPTVVSAYWK
jgi:hypothetical protein